MKTRTLLGAAALAVLPALLLAPCAHAEQDGPIGLALPGSSAGAEDGDDGQSIDSQDQEGAFGSGVFGNGLLGGAKKPGLGHARPLLGDNSTTFEVVQQSQNVLNAVNHASIKDSLHTSIGKQPTTVFGAVTNAVGAHQGIGHGLLGKPSMGFSHLLGPEPLDGDSSEPLEESEQAFN
ncbi:hypothetical protein [Streptomyces sp. NPDC048659]|uniref:hypothetical protein n=1 Tax=Streptomyces sp. NPDC048659 TaxID=3155489 RepID=UPI00341787D3